MPEAAPVMRPTCMGARCHAIPPVATRGVPRYNQVMVRFGFPQIILGGAALASAAALGLAFLAQYGFDLWPCQLCYWQRVPYALVFGFASLALLPGVDPKARRHVVFLCVLLFAANA